MLRGFKHALLGVGLAGLVCTAGCGEVVRQGTGNGFLVIDSLLGAKGGATSATFGNVLSSDVIMNGGIWDDPGRVTMRLVPKDISSTLSTNNWVTINRYRVVFRRADGRNQPGVDVPYAFDGAVTFTVGPEEVTAGFTLVRIQAKLEPPLSTLVITPGALGGAITISTLADVTFYGRDQVGNDISVTGTISINFADWGDPKEQ